MLDQIPVLKDDLQTLKNDIEAEAKTAFQARSEHLRKQLSQVMHQALSQGYRKADLLRAYGTTDYYTVQRLLDLTTPAAAASTQSNLTTEQTGANEYTLTAVQATLTAKKAVATTQSKPFTGTLVVDTSTTPHTYSDPASPLRHEWEASQR